MELHQQWIVTADERRATLFSCTKVAGARWYVDPQRTLENHWENYHEHHRPSALGRGPTANAAQHFASLGHEAEEEHKRFAREVRDWLHEALAELGVPKVDVVAAPRFLGVLRHEFQAPGGRIELHEGELTRLGPDELATHPIILSILPRSASSKAPRT